MADIELTQNYPGGGQPGDCGRILSDNGDGTVHIAITRKNCEPVPDLPISFVRREHLRDCHCDD